MLKTVSVINDRNNRLDLELDKPERSGILIENIDGIGPGQADISMTELAIIDGSYFNSARKPDRQITMKLRLLFNPMVEDSRHKTYEYFRTKSLVRLMFLTDRRYLQIDGYVESNDPSIFEEDEYTDISIVCPNPYFQTAGDGSTTVFSGVDPVFEFPWSNESLSQDGEEAPIVGKDVPTVIFSEIRNLYESNITYDGDAPVGIYINLHFIGTEIGTVIQIYNVDTGDSMLINLEKVSKIVGHEVEPGDDITICTIKGSKSIYYIRGGEVTSILNALDKGTDWIQLQHGNNVLAFIADSEDYLQKIQFSVTNYELYEGV